MKKIKILIIASLILTGAIGIVYLSQMLNRDQSVDSSKASEQEAVSTAGWYSGDNHMHTVYSDGSNAVSDQVNAAVVNGMDFITITDHCTDANLSEINSLNRTDILVIYGEELKESPGKDILAYNIPSAVSCSRSADVLISEVKSLSGLTFIAHPFLSGANWFNWELSDYNGLEVWNAFASYSSTINQSAFLKWDELNKQGRHLIGIANSDAHSALLFTDPPKENYNNRVGNPHINVYLESLTKESVIKAIKNGNFYGTNGPIINFEINSKIMGNDVTINQDSESVNITIKANSDREILRISLIKNGQEYKKWDLNAKTFEETLQDSAKDGDFYRIEVETNDTFAFSNPIWIVHNSNDQLCTKTTECGLMDENSDNKLTLLDLGAFVSVYGNCCSDEIFTGGCGGRDSNGDKIVSLIDLANFVNMYKKESCGF